MQLFKDRLFAAYGYEGQLKGHLGHNISARNANDFSLVHTVTWLENRHDRCKHNYHPLIPTAYSVGHYVTSQMVDMLTEA